ncbi:LEPR-XLL domain-containing protein [Mycobacterium sp. D16R24]
MLVEAIEDRLLLSAETEVAR